METKNLLKFVLGLIFVFGITSCSEDEVFDEQSLLETENTPRMYIKTYAKNYYENGVHAGKEQFYPAHGLCPWKGRDSLSYDRVYVNGKDIFMQYNIVDRLQDNITIDAVLWLYCKSIDAKRLWRKIHLTKGNNEYNFDFDKSFKITYISNDNLELGHKTPAHRFSEDYDNIVYRSYIYQSIPEYIAPGELKGDVIISSPKELFDDVLKWFKENHGNQIDMGDYSDEYRPVAGVVYDNIITYDDFKAEVDSYLSRLGK